MEYRQVMDYLRDALVLGSVPGLDSITGLLDELDNPQRGLSFVHVAGTNGKGSTCAYLAETLTRAGYKTGLFTSPYIRDFSERIQVDGAAISREEVERCGGRVIAAAERMVSRGLPRPTVFELTTAMGFEHFKSCGCGVVVLEVGLGGRLDATNVIEAPAVSVICHIGLDHTELLGDTVEKIALEKAGIIKPGRPVVLFGQSREAEEAVARVCRERRCALTVADAGAARVESCSLDGLVFSYGGYERLRSGLLGLYQVGNAVTAIETLEALRREGWSIGGEALRAGIENALIPGRLELLSRSPAVLADGAHNPQGAQALAESLEAIFPGKKITFIMGALADKDYMGGAAAVSGLAKEFFTVTPPIGRALGGAELAERLSRELGAEARACGSVPEAVDAALEAVGTEGVVCAFGSLYMLSQVEGCFKNGVRESAPPLPRPEYDLQDMAAPAAKPVKKAVPSGRAARSGGSRITTLRLCQVAVLIALEIVLNRFCSINTMGLKLGFSFIPMALCAMLFGPWYAMCAYALSDLLGAVIFPIGPYHPGFTVCAGAMGVIYGLLLYKKFWKNPRFFPHMVLASAAVCIGIGLFTNTLWVAQLYGSRTYWGWFIYRLPQYAVLVPLNLIFLPLLKKLADKLRQLNLVK